MVAAGVTASAAASDPDRKHAGPAQDQYSHLGWYLVLLGRACPEFDLLRHFDWTGHRPVLGSPHSRHDDEPRLDVRLPDLCPAPSDSGHPRGFPLEVDSPEASLHLVCRKAPIGALEEQNLEPRHPRSHHQVSTRRCIKKRNHRLDLIIKLT